MKVAVIGGSGFIGSRLIDLITETTGWEVKNIDLQQSAFFPALTRIGDVRNLGQITGELAGVDAVVLLAAEHRDDITPVDRYYETNVGGMKVTLEAMSRNNITRLIFVSSVAVYGNSAANCDESGTIAPANHYGKSKAEAEAVARQWHESHPDWNIDILRPTVTFGERNRGNVHNLLSQIAGRHFLMVGDGKNRKAMAYVGNVAAFLLFMLRDVTKGFNVFNYTDSPDMTMNELVNHASRELNSHVPAIHFPLWLGMAGGKCFDLLARMLRRKLPISSVRVKKFCISTQFNSSKAHNSGFTAPFTLAEGLSRTLEFDFVKHLSPLQHLKL